MLNLSILLIIYFSLFSVIWLHEVGHALMYKYYGCKENPFHVSVKPYIFFSTPMPVDLVKLQKITLKEDFHIGIAGIIVNLIFGIPLSIFFIYNPVSTQSNILLIFLFFFCLFHLVEAATYMVVNNIFLASDIETINSYKPILRIPTLIIGLLTSVLIYILYISSDFKLHIFIQISVFTLVIAMGVARVIFKIVNKKKSNI